MKVALIADVHGNLPALEAVLADAQKRGAEAIWNAGDFIGYGAFPDQVVTRLQAGHAVSIAGNYDLKAMELGSNRKGQEKKPRSLEKNLAFQWAYAQLSKENRAYLQGLPTEMRFEVEGRRVLLVHGSPASIREFVTDETPEERLLELVRQAGVDLIVFGHSHRAFRRKVAGVWLINPGSVGRPDDGDPRASYAMVQLKKGFFQVRHYRVDYDVEREAAALRDHGLPESFAQMALQGRNLDEVLMKTAPVSEQVAVAEPLEEREVACLDAIRAMVRRCECDVEHVHQVTYLALRLFDELKSLHGLGRQERQWLQYAALLHDVGWIEGGDGHHKVSLRIIQESPLLPFEEHERLIVGTVARYHRGSLPEERHRGWADLSKPERRWVGILAALLRLADGLDYAHEGVVEDLTCKITGHKITIRCVARKKFSDEALKAAEKRGEMLAQALVRKLQIEVEIRQ